MKRLFKVFLSLTIIASFLNCGVFSVFDAYAESRNIEVVDASIKAKSPTISVAEPTISGNQINSNIRFNELNDFVTFSLSFKNTSPDKFKIASIYDNNTSKYITLDYDYPTDYIETDDTTTVLLRITYAEQLLNQNLTLDNLAITIDYETPDGANGNFIFAPNAGFFTNSKNETLAENIVATVFIVALAGAGVILLLIKKKANNIKLIGCVLLVLAMLVPFAAFATEKLELSMTFDNVEIRGEFETYNITINPGENTDQIVKEITYGEPVGDLVPAAIEGYDLDKWVDNNGNEVTPETIVTAAITIEAKYVPTTYDILYALNGGALSESQNNPDAYTIESDTITLANPERLGYTFSGWTGSNGNTPETVVVIPAGSIGDKSYTANFTPNTDTPYTVIHAYQALDNAEHYEEAEPITYYGTTDSVVEMPLSPKYGFVSPAVQDVSIKPDGSAEVYYYYDREYFDFSLTSRDELDPGCVYYSQCSENRTYPYETPIHIKLKHRDGYHVVWSTGATGDEIDFQLTSDVVLSYTYEPNHYTVKYHKGEDGATGEVEDQEFVYDEEQALRMNGFEYEGHTFHGWGHGTDWWWHVAGEGAVVKNLTGEENGVVDMYASWWLNKYEVSYYDKDADNVLMRRSGIEHGSLAPTPNFTPTKPLYEFAGWYADDTYNIPYNFETMPVTGPTTIYAKFNYLCGGFENDSWGKIVDDLTENPELYPTGCKKGIEMDLDGDSENETVSVKLVNTSTPEVCATPGFSQTACGLVLEFENTIGSHTMNNTRGEYSSYGGWKETILATWLNNDFYNKLPGDLRSVIIPTGPIVSSSGSDGVSDNIELTDFGKTYLYIPSGREVGLNLDHDNKKDETTDTRNLDFYSFSNYSSERQRRRKKTNLAGEEVSWWLRTADFTYDWVFYRIEPSGDQWTGGSNAEYEVLPMFRIGKTPEYTATFETDGAGAIPSQTVQYGGLVTRPAEDPVKEHYEFKGWYADSNFEHEFDFGTGLAANQTIYAKFEIIKLEASFNTDGGTSIETQTVNHGQHVVRPAEDPHKDHYHFDGWYTDGEFSTEFNFAETVITSDVTIYAKFTPDSYTVSFNVDGGTEVAAQTITYPGKASRPNQDPEKASYRFDGWFADDTCETEFNFDDTIIGQDTTIYAKFTLVTHSVSFATDGGSEIATQTVNHGQYATRPAENPTKGALEFYDWFADEDCTIRFDFENTQITDNTTVYAKYKTNFATDDWNTIKNSLVLDSNFYAVGSEKEVELDIDNNGTNESYTVRLANASTPEVCNTNDYSQTACGFVIEFVDLPSSTKMNYRDSTIFGWSSMDLMRWLNEDFYEKLPADLREVIIPTYPIVSSEPDGRKSVIRHGSYNINKIYIPSSREVGLELGSDDSANDVNVDTRTYDYYVTHASDAHRIKKDLSGTSQDWWLRTAKTNETGEFFAISASGGATAALSTTAKYFAPAFRIDNAPTYTVTFNTNGGTEIASQKVKYAKKATRPDTAPQKAGTQFVNWYADSDYINEFDFDVPIIEDKTVYAYYKDQFDLDSWATIKENVASNPNYYPVGSRKQIQMDMNDDGTNEVYNVRLVNTSTPNECRTSSTLSQTGCGVVIEFFTLPVMRGMNTSDTISGGWKNSNAVTYLNSTFYDKLPEDLRNIIIPTYPIASGKFHNDKSDDITADDTSKNKIFILAPRELGVNTSGQDTRYDDNRTLDYYVGTDSAMNSYATKRIKQNLSGGAEMYWTRTVRKEIWSKFYFVLSDGRVDFNFSSNYSMGLAPAFRIAAE